MERGAVDLVNLRLNGSSCVELSFGAKGTVCKTYLCCGLQRDLKGLLVVGFMELTTCTYLLTMKTFKQSMAVTSSITDTLLSCLT